jgi:uncharacterized protein involved in exopolysaccharide biosynthesis
MTRSDEHLAAVFYQTREVLGAVAIVAIVFGARVAAAAEGNEASALLRVGYPPSASGSPVARDANEFERFRRTQASLIKSQSVLQQALKASGIADLPMLVNQSEAMKFLENGISVVVPPEQELLEVKLTASDRKQAAKIVNAVVQAYMDTIVSSAQTERLRAWGQN